MLCPTCGTDNPPIANFCMICGTQFRAWEPAGAAAASAAAPVEAAEGAPPGSEAGPASEVRWVEVFGQSLQLHITPLVPAELFRKQMLDHPRAWIFTSATLAMGEDFSHFKRELGIEEAAAHTWPSPFDFRRQALLYSPRGLPASSSDSTTSRSSAPDRKDTTQSDRC